MYEGSRDLTRGYSDILDMQDAGSRKHEAGSRKHEAGSSAVLGEESVPNAAMLLAPLKNW
jgi:hypothetical protein